MLPKYRPSGHLSPLYAPAVLGVVVAGAGLAWVYQFATWWVPFVYLNAVLALLAGAAMAGLHVVAARFGKCRSVPVALAVGLITGGLALADTHYFNYLNWRGSIPESERAGYTFSRHWERRVEEGWSVGRRRASAPITGTAVYVIWGIEGALFVGLAALGALYAAKTPYDEVADDWMKQAELLSTPTSADDAQRLKAANSVEQLLMLPRRVKMSHVVVRYKLASAGRAGEPSYLSIESETTEKGSKGEDKTTTKTLQSWVRLEPAQAGKLLRMAKTSLSSAPSLVAPK